MPRLSTLNLCRPSRYRWKFPAHDPLSVSSVSVVCSIRGGIRGMAHAPTRVITVEREYGSQGGEFAHELAERLGWRLLDSELVKGAARVAGVDPKLAAQFDE